MNMVDEIKRKTLFVTGTDTGVGKTVVSSLLLGYLLDQGIEAGYQKWVSTGGEMAEDLLYCLSRNGLELDTESGDDQVVFQFRLPASPHLSAEMEGREVTPARIREAFYRYGRQKEMLLVEGVGGLMVPLRRDLLLADFLGELKLPALIVARSGLGTINHSLLTIEALRKRDIPVFGVVFVDEAEGMTAHDLLVRDNVRTIGELGGVDVFGRIPRSDDYGVLESSFRTIARRILEKIQNP